MSSARWKALTIAQPQLRVTFHSAGQLSKATPDTTSGPVFSRLAPCIIMQRYGDYMGTRYIHHTYIAPSLDFCSPFHRSRRLRARHTRWNCCLVHASIAPLRPAAPILASRSCLPKRRLHFETQRGEPSAANHALAPFHVAHSV